ncbi:unnamed protein product [Camellia sinensis]
MSCSEKNRGGDEGEYEKPVLRKSVEDDPKLVSHNGSITCPQLTIDESLLVDPKLLFIGSKIGEGAHGKVYEGSTYVHCGEKKNMAVTQFEPANARRCFPCWDEPAEFPVRLENPHVILANQLWAGVVPAGPSGYSFNSSYRSRDSIEYKLELGNAIE